MVKTNKFENFKRACKRLNEMNTRYKSSKQDSAVQDALIKRFEFTYDLAWKSMREFLIMQGIEVMATPRCVFAEAYRTGFLKNESLWLEMISARNSTSHLYSEELAIDVADNISLRYSKEITALLVLYESV